MLISKAKFKDQMITDGVLKHLSVLISSNNVQLRLKAFEVLNGFVGKHGVCTAVLTAQILTKKN
jgi:hypothetical protein